MSGYLLDVNVLIALIDEQHAHHGRALAWFMDEPDLPWVSCPTTQNGAIRIVGNPAYTAAFSVADVRRSLRILLSYGEHRFVPDDISLLDEDYFDAVHLLSSRQLIDTYLLALAACHDVTLATFDRRIAMSAVRSDKKSIYLIP